MGHYRKLSAPGSVSIYLIMLTLECSFEVEFLQRFHLIDVKSLYCTLCKYSEMFIPTLFVHTVTAICCSYKSSPASFCKFPVDMKLSITCI